jgi:hypothetical protein
MGNSRTEVKKQIYAVQGGCLFRFHAAEICRMTNITHLSLAHANSPQHTHRDSAPLADDATCNVPRYYLGTVKRYPRFKPLPLKLRTYGTLRPRRPSVGGLQAFSSAQGARLAQHSFELHTLLAASRMVYLT